MSDDLPALTPEQIAAFHRAAATLKDEDFGPEEMAGIRKGWLQLTKDRAYSGRGVHYEQPAIRGQPPRGSFRLPRDVIAQLGDGDLKAGGAVVAGISPSGASSVAASMLRRQSARRNPSRAGSQ